MKRKERRDLEKEADRIIREAGGLKEYGILDDDKPAEHEWRVGHKALEYLASISKDRRSTHQKSIIVKIKSGDRDVRSTDPSGGPK